MKIKLSVFTVFIVQILIYFRKILFFEIDLFLLGSYSHFGELQICLCQLKGKVYITFIVLLSGGIIKFFFPRKRWYRISLTLTFVSEKST